MRLLGKCVKRVERIGDFDKAQADGTVESIHYDHDVVTVLVDGLDSIEVKVPGDQRHSLGSLNRGDDVEFEVDVPKGTKLTFINNAASLGKPRAVAATS